MTYATAPTPPSGDDSTKVATTAFVAGKTAAIPPGNVAVWSRDFTTGNSTVDEMPIYAPKGGGTWFCWGYASCTAGNGIATLSLYGKVVSSGGTCGTVHRTNNYVSPGFRENSLMAIKIA